MRGMRALQVEEAITARVRLKRPEIVRIGIERGAQGWRCEHVWFAEGYLKLSEGRKMAVLAEAA